MRIAVRFSLLFLSLSVVYAGTATLQDALAALASKDGSTYEQAEAYLAKHSQQAEPLLRAMFHDTNQPPLARLRAAKLLGDLDDKGAIDDMKKVLFSGGETNAAVRVEIIRSLAKLGSNRILIDYLKSGRERSPSASAAIAVSLQGRSDDDSKKALSSLLRDDDPRVVQAAIFAVSKTYKNISNQDPTTSSKASGSSNNRLSFGIESVAGDKLDPTPGDEAIFHALQSKQNFKDPQISQDVTALLTTISEHYKEQ